MESRQLSASVVYVEEDGVIEQEEKEEEQEQGPILGGGEGAESTILVSFYACHVWGGGRGAACLGVCCVSCMWSVLLLLPLLCSSGFRPPNLSTSLYDSRILSSRPFPQLSKF